MNYRKMASNVGKSSNNTNGKVNDKQPQVLILEQPSSKGLRFRYECEKKYAAAIVGVNSKEHKRTYPTIKIVNWKGPVRIVVSCVTRDPPYRPHPHNLLGKIKVVDGVCQFEFKDTQPALCLENLSIQCVKKKDVAKSLAVREKLGIDPFNTGFDHASNPNCIDLYSLRLCVQIFLEGKTQGVFDEPLHPVITDPINDRRSKSEPEIVHLTSSEGSVAGGEELGILCERADKDDTDVLFYREENNWEKMAQLHKLGVFKRVAVIIKTPPYEDRDITEPVEVKVLLRRRSTGDVSDSFPFTYIPGKSNPLKRKRDEYMYTSCERLQKVLEKNQVLSKNMDTCDAFNLPAQESNNDNSRELESVTDLSVDACEYSDPLKPKNMNSSNNHHARNANEPKDEPQNWNYSNTLNSDDWIHELLQTIEDDLLHKHEELEIVKEPEIKYISPDPITNVTNTIPEIQNPNNIINNNNNHQGPASFNISHFTEKIQTIPEFFPTEMSNITNISKLQQEQPPVIPQDHFIRGQYPQYAMNINENQWHNTLNNVTNRQPLMCNNYQYPPGMPANFSQMTIYNNFNEQSSGNYAMDNESYRIPVQSFDHENAWRQIQRATLNEFDPLCPSNWDTLQEYNDYTQ